MKFSADTLKTWCPEFKNLPRRNSHPPACARRMLIGWRDLRIGRAKKVRPQPHGHNSLKS